MEVGFSSFNWLSVCRFPIALVDEAALALPALSGDVLAVQEDALPALLALLSPKDRLAWSVTTTDGVCYTFHASSAPAREEWVDAVNGRILGGLPPSPPSERLAI